MTCKPDCTTINTRNVVLDGTQATWVKLHPCDAALLPGSATFNGFESLSLEAFCDPITGLIVAYGTIIRTEQFIPVLSTIYFDTSFSVIGSLPAGAVPCSAAGEDIEHLLTQDCCREVADPTNIFSRLTIIPLINGIVQTETTLFVQNGVVSTSAFATPFECFPCNADTEILTLCDDDTPFLRRYDVAGNTTDTELDGVTPYIVTGAINLCSLIPEVSCNIDQLKCCYTLDDESFDTVATGNRAFNGHGVGGIGGVNDAYAQLINVTNPSILREVSFYVDAAAGTATTLIGNIAIYQSSDPNALGTALFTGPQLTIDTSGSGIVPITQVIPNLNLVIATDYIIVFDLTQSTGPGTTWAIQINTSDTLPAPQQGYYRDGSVLPTFQTPALEDARIDINAVLLTYQSFNGILVIKNDNACIELSREITTCEGVIVPNAVCVPCIGLLQNNNANRVSLEGTGLQWDKSSYTNVDSVTINVVNVGSSSTPPTLTDAKGVTSPLFEGESITWESHNDPQLLVDTLIVDTNDNNDIITINWTEKV